VQRNLRATQFDNPIVVSLVAESAWLVSIPAEFLLLRAQDATKRFQPRDDLR